MFKIKLLTFIFATCYKRPQPMEQQTLEFFKLDEIDRKVFFWMIDHAKAKAIKSWLTYIEGEYKRKQIAINADKLFTEAKALIDQQPTSKVEVRQN